MPKFDAAASAALGGQVIAPAFFIFLDIDGLAPAEQRATTFGSDVTFAGTGDPDLDGHTFPHLNPRFLEIGEVGVSEAGSETVTVTLSGILSIHAPLLNLIADPAKWRGRAARLWVRLHDEDGAPIGGIAGYYSGYMTAPEIVPTPTEQTILLKLENYQASSSEASNRDYLSQAEFDPADQSARATIGAANAGSAGPAAAITGGGSGGGEGGGGSLPGRMVQKLVHL
jgi:hypothetical protein